MLDKSTCSELCDSEKMMEGYGPRSDGLAAVYTRNRPQETDKFDKKVRREIANSNERRRMQSINAGYHSLKALIPHHDGEKLSKAAILQQTGEHIQTLEEEKSQLMLQNVKLSAQNAQLKRLVFESEREKEHMFNESPPPKRKKRDTESSDEGISMGSSLDSNEDNIEDLQRLISELKNELDRERRRVRGILEERSRTMENQIYSDKLYDINNPYVQTDLNKMTNEFVEVKTSDEPIKDVFSSYTESMTPSRTNSLDALMGAIRQVEGIEERAAYEDNHRIPNTNIQRRLVLSEESEKDSSDQENKSESSDQEVPINYTHRIHRHRFQKSYQNNDVNEENAQSEKYPIETISQSYPDLYSPGVIIHHSS